MNIFYVRILLLPLLLLPFGIQAQTGITFDIQDEYYYRVLQISDRLDTSSSFNLRPFTFTAKIDQVHPWSGVLSAGGEGTHYISSEHFEVDFFEPLVFQSYNTTLPRGSNDGPVWQGKGYNVAFTIGTEASFGPLTVRFRPSMGMAQNRAYDLGPYELSQVTKGLYKGVDVNRFAYRDFRGSIDYVQRYGEDTFSWFDWGDSSIELRYGGLRAAFSNRQIWTGPAINTSLHYGYSAPGFRHFFLGTYTPIETPAGAFEFAYIFGKMNESDYYTMDRVVESQSANSLVFIYNPWFTEHFSVGAIRTFIHTYPVSFSDYKNQALKLFQTGLKNSLATEENPDGNNPDNQMASIFFRYYLPDYGFELYWEYGRNDHNADWRDFLAQPNHHRAYSLGATKTFTLPQERILAVNFEMNQLEAMRTALTRGNQHLGGWYTHTNQIMGFTNRGQVLGTGYGPGVNMQMLRADLFDEKGGIGFKIARITYHNSRMDQFYSFIEEANSKPVEPWEVRNVELMMGVQVKAFMPYNLEISAGIDQSFIMNQHYLKNNDLANTRVEIIIRKQIDGWLR